jgi:subtilisin family serine protease
MSLLFKFILSSYLLLSVGVESLAQAGCPPHLKAGVLGSLKALSKRVLPSQCFPARAIGEYDKYLVRGMDERPPARRLDEIYDFSLMKVNEIELLQKLAQDQSRTLVAMVDSGIDYNHPALAYKTPRNPKDPNRFLRSTRLLPYDFINHGTSVAGIITGGCEDVALLPVERSLELNNYQGIFSFAQDLGGDIVNISFGLNNNGSKAVQNQESFIKGIQDHPDILFVAAAGNEGLDNDLFFDVPGSLQFSNLLVVGSVTSDDALADFSNFGKQTVHLGAPGVDVPVLYHLGEYGVSSGSSLSAPLVTQICARIRRLNPALSPEGIIRILEASVRKVEGLKNVFKWGGVPDVELALKLAEDSLKWNFTKGQKLCPASGSHTGAASNL